MSRELKFRVWDKKRSRYVGDGEIVFKSYGNEAAVVVCPNSQDYIGDICHDEYTDDGRFVVEQDTGLKDKNGEEIYEGDILWWENYNGMNGRISEHTAEVYYDENLAGYFVSYADTSLSELLMEEEVYVSTNIHENKEEK